MRRVFKLPAAPMLWVLAVVSIDADVRAQPVEAEPAAPAPAGQASEDAAASSQTEAAPATAGPPVTASGGEPTPVAEPSAAAEALAPAVTGSDSAPDPEAAASGAERIEVPTSTRMQVPVVVEMMPHSSERVGFDEGFFIESSDGDNRLSLAASAQARIGHRRVDGDGNETTLGMPRARLSLHGHVYDPRFAYRFELGFDDGDASLQDAYLDYALVTDWPRVRVGNQRRPFARQRITPGNELELIKRAITQYAFGANRDLGVLLHNGYDQSPRFEYAVGLFAGRGVPPRSVAQQLAQPSAGDPRLGEVAELQLGPTGGLGSQAGMNPTVVGRVGYNFNGIDGYREADFSGGDLRASVALAALIAEHRVHNLGSQVLEEGDSQFSATLDYLLKVDGFSAGGALFVSSAQNGTDLTDRRRDAAGLHVQAGYLIGGTYQPVLRYALVDPQLPVDRQLQEITAGLSLYAVEHAVKWQTAWTVYVIGVDGGDRISHFIDSQVQFGF